MTSRQTQLNAVIGFPIGHSRSPALHNAVYQKLNIDARMLAFSHKDVKALVEAIKALNIGLTAVTMPFKASIIPFLNVIDSKGRAMGAVNTVINKKGKLYGYNTDIDGIAAALKEINMRGKNILLLGAGGAARAAAYYVKSKGGKIMYLNRSPLKALNLKKQFGGRVVALTDLKAAEIDVVINATPVGMHPKINASPLPKNLLRKGQFVFDLVYNPIETKLLKDARSMGAKTVSGIDMFVGQALKQIELYSQKKTSTTNIIKLAGAAVIKTL